MPSVAKSKSIEPNRRLGFGAALSAGAAAVASHLALAFGQPYGALGLAAMQALATGGLLWLSLPGRRWLGPLVAFALLAALALGARHSPAAGLLAAAGMGHALLYSALLVVFATTLRPGQVALVTWVAGQVNPGFHAGMIGYTRAVTWAWVGLFAVQLLGSAILLATDLPLWSLLVTVLHLPLVLLMALFEVLVRRWRWRHERPSGLLETIRGVRRLSAQRAANSSISR